MPAFGLVHDRVHFIKIKQDFVDVMPSLLPGKQGAKRYLRLFLHRLVGQIVDPRRGQIEAVKADLPPIIVKLIRQFIQGILSLDLPCKSIVC